MPASKPAREPACQDAATALTELHKLADPAEKTKIAKRIPIDQVIGIRMKHVFDLARDSTYMDLTEVQTLLRDDWYEARLMAVSILDFRARRSPASEPDRHKIYDMYLTNHDHINSWDLVDRAAPRVIGDYLLDRPKDPLFDLAHSNDPMRRRTAIVASLWLARNNQPETPFVLLDLLLDDSHHFVQTALGILLRELAKTSPDQTQQFVENNRHRLAKDTKRVARLASKTS